MRKYYIPTSSLNFNNILSSESISPKSFYERRGFGYSSWFDVKENNIVDAIIFYGEPHEFVRPKSDIEDHPMLVEIVTDEEFTPLINGVYYSQQTIYINPWQTRFIFFSERVRTTVLSMSDSSLETKMVRLYRQQMAVEHFEGEYPSIGNIKIIPNSSSIKNIEKDVYINKMKGLLYGYYIGAYLSMSLEQVEKLTVLREIQNIFYSVISSYDKTISKQQTVRFKELFSCFAVNLCGELKKEEDLGKVMAILKQYGLFITSCSNIITELASEKIPNPAVKWIEAEIDNINRSIKRNLLNTNEEQIIVSSVNVTSQKAIKDEELGNLYLVWVNKVLISSQYNGKISPIKASISDEITKKAKEILGDKWETSCIRTYLNQLRRHIRGEEFNQEWNNGLLSSMAAVLLKGDDWETLLRFMQDKGMNDYRIAYSIYGILNGFANLTRDFTDLLINQDSNYVADVYKEFYGQLLGKDITISNKSIEKKQTINEIKSNISSLQDKKESDLNMWRNEIFEFAEKNLNNKKCLLSIRKTLEQFDRIDNSLLLSSLLNSDNGVWKTQKKGAPNIAWKKLQDFLKPKPNIIEKNLFSNDSDLLAEKRLAFYKDPDSIKELCNIIGEKAVKDVLWFFDDLKKNPSERKYYQNIEATNNKWVIDTFCKSERIKKMIGHNIEKIRKFFYEKYGIR